MPTAKVLYIAGESRSGTTLLEMTLAQVGGFFASGELRYLWTRGLMDNQLCGCGVPLRQCPTWRDILLRAFETDLLESHEARKRLCALQLAVDQPRSVFRNAFFSLRRYTAAYQSGQASYIETLGRLYRAIAESTGAEWIIDSSKAPSHGFLAGQAAHVHVIHLVRDVRAVAFSLQRKKQRPEITDRQAFMPTYPAWKTALRWRLTNRVCGRFAQHGGYTLVRYEDFVREPGPTVQRILRDVGVINRPLDFIDGTTVHLGGNHTVAGNPIRFKSGPITLQLDDQWRKEMRCGQRRLVQALARGALRHYGYPPD